MAEWAYLQEYVKLDRKQASSLADLQQHGADGWELVSAVPLPKRARRSSKADVLLIFKRPDAAANGDVGRSAPSEEPVADATRRKASKVANGKDVAAEPEQLAPLEA